MKKVFLVGAFESNLTIPSIIRDHHDAELRLLTGIVLYHMPHMIWTYDMAHMVCRILYCPYVSDPFTFDFCLVNLAFISQEKFNPF